MRFHVITIFPDIFDSYLNESIIGRAVKNKHIEIKFYNPRDFVPGGKTNYKPVDDKPYGGGPGMVMRAGPIIKVIEKVISLGHRPATGEAKIKSKKFLIINFIPTAEKFTTASAKKISKNYKNIILICGRYEGIDARIDKIFKTKKFSIGDYVVTGGELPAMVLIDCISRQIPGVLGKFESLEENRVSNSEVYTRPEIIKYKNKNYKVPKVLLSGHHAKIEEWKKGLTKKQK